MSNRVFNFSAGPAMLPESILLEAQSELLNWQGLGMSVMEVGHRTTCFQSLLNEIENDLRDLLQVPHNYHVLFLSGAARTQFAMIPMNLLAPTAEGAYLISGLWSSMAYEEASRLGKAYCVASSEQNGFTDVPDYPIETLSSNTAYFYYTPNETIHGVRFAAIPSHGNAPLIADMTSCLLTESLNIQDYDLIFAGAQKNISAAGLTIVIMRDTLLQQRGSQVIPTMLDYNTHIKYHSNYATPAGFNFYLAGKMFKWVKSQGGVDAMQQLNQKKASSLYQYIDESPFYHCKVAESARSIVNVCFSLTKPELEKAFIEQAQNCGLWGLQGHRMAGGLRASLYNAMPMEGVQLLIDFMHAFYKENK